MSGKITTGRAGAIPESDSPDIASVASGWIARSPIGAAGIGGSTRPHAGWTGV